MKIALAQLNYLIGDFEGNKKKILDAVSGAAGEKAALVIFSELSICGYPPLDLLEREDFINDCNRSLREIAEGIDPGIGVLIGAPEFNPEKQGKMLFNSAFFLLGGRVAQVFRKSLLPTYDIFDEYRYFEPNRTFHLLEFNGRRIAVTICEDLWDEQPFESDFSRSKLYTLNPLEELSKQGPELIINLAASPFSRRK